MTKPTKRTEAERNQMIESIIFWNGVLKGSIKGSVAYNTSFARLKQLTDDDLNAN